MKIEHIAMYVNNLEGAKDFFEHYCGGTANRLYHNPSTRFSSYFISFEDGARLELMHKHGISMQERTAERTGFVHLSFSLGSKEKVDTITEQLRHDGYEVKSGPRTTGDGYYESCVAGFEGNLLEFTV
ncbi:MAG: VOC family protein [Solobacterium sp.]|nr:VOC family protein [Solobacterium sp.]